MWLSQPQFPAQLDRSHPLTRGLQFCFDGRSRRDAVSGRLLKPAKPSFIKEGLASSITDQTNIPQLADRIFTAGSGLTLFVLLRHDTLVLDMDRSAIGRGSWDDSTDTCLALLTSGDLMLFSSTMGGAFLGTLPGAGGVHSYGCVAAGTTVKGYIDGLESGTDTAYSYYIDTASNTWLVGAPHVNLLAEHLPGDYLFAAAWNRPLTAREIKELHKNPWQIYARCTPDRLLAVPSDSVPVYGTHGQWGKTLLLEGWFGEYAGIKGWYAVDFLTPAAPGGMVIKAWAGSVWTPGALKRWNGTEWVSATLKRWNGSAWV